MGDLQCSVVIPIIPKHFIYLGKLLTELKNESDYVGEILICASSLNSVNLQKLRELVFRSDLRSKIKILPSLERKTAGQNRNRGWEASVFEIVSFLDADDLYHPRRLQIISRIMREKGADAVIHDYYRMTTRFRFRSKISDTAFINANDLLSANQMKFTKLLPNGNLYFGEANILLPKNISQKHKVHHGHLTVRKSLSFRYTDRELGEDGELISEILKNNKNVIYLPLKLSIYDRLNFRNLYLSGFGHVKVKASKVYRFCFAKK